MCLCHNTRAVGYIAANHNRIGVQRLGQLERTGPRGMKALRQPQVIQRIHPVRSAHGRETRGGKAGAQDLRRGLANPLQAGLAGAIVKGQHQQDAAPALGGPRTGVGGSGLGVGVRRRGEGEQKPQSRKGSYLPTPAETR